MLYIKNVKKTSKSQCTYGLEIVDATRKSTKLAFFLSVGNFPSFKIEVANVAIIDLLEKLKL